MSHRAAAKSAGLPVPISRALLFSEEWMAWLTASSVSASREPKWCTYEPWVTPASGRRPGR